MKITELEMVGYRIPFSETFSVSYGTHTATEHIFLRLRTDTSHVGYGEGTALPWFTGEVTEGMLGVIDRYLNTKVTQRSLEDAITAFDEFHRKFPGAPGAKAAVEMALLDLRAKQLNVPLWELFGTKVRDSIPVTHIVPALPPAEAASAVETAAADGYRSFKLKATGELDTDIERINGVTDVLPSGAVVRIDPNTGWNRYPDCMRVIDALDDPDRIEYIEQPVATNRIEEMRRLWNETMIPIFADESFSGPEDVASHIDSVAGCHLKLAKTGSIRELREMQQIAARGDMTVSVVSAFGSSLEAAANLHLATVTPNLSAGMELCTGLLNDDPVEAGITPNPSVTLPDGPGIGCTLDDALFESDDAAQGSFLS